MNIAYRNREPIAVHYSLRQEWNQEGYLVPAGTEDICEEDYTFGTYVVKEVSLVTGEVFYQRPEEICRPVE